MLKFLKEFEFVNGVRWYVFGIFFLNFDFFDGNELGGVVMDMVKEYKGVGIFFEFFVC